MDVLYKVYWDRGLIFLFRIFGFFNFCDYIFLLLNVVGEWE